MTATPRTLRPRTPLAPGENSIKSGSPSKTPTGYRLFWSGVLPDGRTIRGDTTGKTITQVQRRATRRWERELADYHSGGGAGWSPRDPLAGWIEAQALPAVDDRTDIRDSSKTSARIALRHVAAWAREGHHTLHTGTRPLHVAALIKHVRTSSGDGAARHVKHAYSYYIARPLIVNRLIETDPAATIHDPNPPGRPRDGEDGVVALTAGDYHRVLDYLLGEELTGAIDGRRVPWLSQKSLSKPASVTKARALIDAALLQMTTGLRVLEATQVRWSAMDVDDTDDGFAVTVTVSAAISKTGRERTVTILDDRVAVRFAAKRAVAQGDHYICGAPTDTAVQWDPANLRKANRAFYNHLAEKLVIPELKSTLTHVWRATLSSMLYGSIADDVRLEFFGHSSAVANNHYLSRQAKRDRQAAVMLGAMKELRSGS